MKEAFIALGANLGEREKSMAEALRRLEDTPGIEVLRVSGVYETDPVGYADQPAFLNMAAALAVELGPAELLRCMLDIEREMGRVRDIRWGPRIIDLDLLFYEDAAMDTEELTLPHPRLGERAFVLVPLRDVWNKNDFPWENVIAAEARRDAGIRYWGRLERDGRRYKER